MRYTTAAMAALMLFLAAFTPVSAQSQSNTPSTRPASERRQLYDASQFTAPVGHRQPRPAEIRPPEQVATDPMEDLERENAMLARRISGICRGC